MTANEEAIAELLKKFENDIIMLDALYQWASNSTGVTAVRRKCPPSHKLIEENIKRRYNLDSDKGQYIYNKLIQAIENAGIDFTTGYLKEYIKNINEKYGAVLREKTIERLNKASQEAKYIVWLYCKVKDRGGLFPYTDDYNDWRIGSMYKFAAIFNATFNSAITPTRKTIAIDVLIEIGFINKLNWITADCNKDRDEYIFPEYLEPIASKTDEYITLPDLPDYERYIDALYDKKLIDALIYLDELLHKGYVSEIDELHGKLIPQPYIIGKSGNAVAINPRIYESFKEIFFERKAKELKKENEIDVALNQLAEEKYYPVLSISEEEFELFNASRIWLVDTHDKSLAEYETLIVLTPWLTGNELKWLRDNYSQKFVVIISTFMGLPKIQKLYKDLYGPLDESGLNWMIVDVSREEVHEMIVNAKPKLFDELIEIVKEIKPLPLPVPPPKLKVHPNSYDFGDVKQGIKPSHPFTVENVGGGTLEWEVRNVPDWLDVSTTSGTNDGSFTVTLKSDASVGDYDGTVEVISNDGSESIDVSGHIGERGGGTFPPPPNGSILLVGYECGTGSPVNIKPAHLFISGLTQKAGKTTTLEALVLRSGLKTISFITKPNEKCFDTGEYHLPFFQEKAEWRVIEKLFEAQLGEKMKDIRAKLIELCKHEKTLESIKDKIDEALDSSKGSERKSLVLLQAYFEELFNALAGKEYTNTLDLKRGINLMDLTGYNEELQSYIINSVLNEILKNQKNTVVIIPEAWKFIPQSKSSACKYSIDQLIRQGAVNNNFVWFDSQDIAGVDKSMLKSVSIWILGIQTEINEVQHTINQIPLPKNQKPTEDQIMNLDVGVFFVCADGIAKKTYVMPKWKSEEEAKEIAISMEQFKK